MTRVITYCVMKTRDFVGSQTLTRLNQAHLSLKLVRIALKQSGFAIATRKMVKFVICNERNVSGGLTRAEN